MKIQTQTEKQLQSLASQALHKQDETDKTLTVRSFHSDSVVDQLQLVIEAQTEAKVAQLLKVVLCPKKHAGIATTSFAAEAAAQALVRSRGQEDRSVCLHRLTSQWNSRVYHLTIMEVSKTNTWGADYLCHVQHSKRSALSLVGLPSEADVGEQSVCDTGIGIHHHSRETHASFPSVFVCFNLLLSTFPF